ncbi:hypothetical protein F4808DRAFT_316360 [Astrocystis sublimbata]|nr:hypothetical protein F4808DRAFT_316360 [Astrocystis sublimbata]
MASNNPNLLASVNRTSSRLNSDIWHLVLELMVCRKDVYNVCLTSRALFAVALPHLYKTLTLAVRPCNATDCNGKQDAMLCSCARSLSSRLLDTRNERLRNAVRELEFGQFEERDLIDMETRLMTLVDCLPNLQRIKIMGRLTQKTLEILDGHHRQIPLYLLGENGTRPIEGSLRNVVALAARVDPLDNRVKDFRRGDGSSLHMQGIYRLLFACPNLTSFSLETLWKHGGKLERQIPQLESQLGFRFVFSRTEVFPPLRDLTLNGYRGSEWGWDHIRKRFRWSELRSLTLGPGHSTVFLEFAARRVKFLKNLTVEKYSNIIDPNSDPPKLDYFLETFTSLERLTVKGYYLPVGSIGNHPGLRHLCLHTFERGQEGAAPRPTLSIEQLQQLDRSCADLETLEIDLYRDGEWPECILKPLASGFRNLRSLTLHLELGLRSMGGWTTPNEYIYIEPRLTKDAAQELGERFFRWRPPSKLSTLVLKTGEPLRRFSYWDPPFYVLEQEIGYTMVIHRPMEPCDVPEVSVSVTPYE